MTKRSIIGLLSIGIVGTMILFLISTGSGVSAENLESKLDVPVDKTWTVNFSQLMDDSSFTDETVRVFNEDGQQVSISYELAENDRELLIHPPESLYLLNESYTLELSQQIKSQSDESLREDVTFQFHTTSEIPTIEDGEQLAELMKESIERDSFAQPEAATEESDTSSDSSGSNQSSAVSETNTQVEGVDEADIIKATQDFTYFVRDGEVTITSNAAPNAEVVASIVEKDFHPNQLYVKGDQLIVIGHGQFFDKSTFEKYDIAPSLFYGGTAEVRLYDISNPSKPVFQRNIQLSGFANTSRVIDGHLYVVANHHTYLDPREEKEMDFRPLIFDSSVHENPERIQYESIHYFPKKNMNNFMTLASIPLDQPDSSVSIESYLGASEDIYVSKNNMYVTSTEVKRSEKNGEIRFEDVHTNVKQFSIKDGTVTFKNEQHVPGRVLNQFSMDERNEVFSIATTTGNRWRSETPSRNHLFTYDLSLNRLGSVEGLAEGERIYSARFIEDRAYLVTFEQVDPLFVIDLKDPGNPNVLGKLKIPGFSNYLHPLGDNHVLGFGRQTELVDNPDGGDPFVRTTGMKISMFNVEDVTNPVEQDSVVIGGYGYSELNYNHKALYWHPEKNIFGLPVNAHNPEDKTHFNGAYLFEVDKQDGLSEKANFTLQPEGKENWYYSLRRMISVGDDLYAFSDKNMKAYDLTEMEELQELTFPTQPSP
ncbi:beta-propeller domain-containing protein [Halobacillus locisalis]|uniref:Beta-propeller domain-containing protein n=1 Tax=Halobacillus locisalis TaxID=220753 RepID=A0A838CPI5_9BACI|nr:beta-propeller domain-containing protein [Halobacillus locisalis]MBA2173977.1 beta-propeller domain-containing protein [Halobacillus locisalis]